MIRLLVQPKGSGYPADFLRARLRGKRHRQVVAADEGAWSRLQDELRWVYVTMQRPLRRRFAPFFLLLELRTLQMILRAVAGEDRDLLAQVCADSLLAPGFLASARGCREVDALFDLFDAWFGDLLPEKTCFARLNNCGGNRAVEEGLVDAFLQALAGRTFDRELDLFVQEQVDLRNLLTVARYHRWELDGPPLLTGGGTISADLQEAGRDRPLAEVLRRIGSDLPTDIALLEAELNARIDRRLRVAARDPLGSALILEYLWSRYREFRRAGVRRWAGDVAGAWEETI